MFTGKRGTGLIIKKDHMWSGDEMVSKAEKMGADADKMRPRGGSQRPSAKREDGGGRV